MSLLDQWTQRVQNISKGFKRKYLLLRECTNPSRLWYKFNLLLRVLINPSSLYSSFRFVFLLEVYITPSILYYSFKFLLVLQACVPPSILYFPFNLVFLLQSCIPPSSLYYSFKFLLLLQVSIDPSIYYSFQYLDHVVHLYLDWIAGNFSPCAYSTLLSSRSREGPLFSGSLVIYSHSFICSWPPSLLC